MAFRIRWKACWRSAFVGLLGMAKKGGDVVLGFDQVHAALQKRAAGTAAGSL
jgi:hypothetical protein